MVIHVHPLSGPLDGAYTRTANINKDIAAMLSDEVIEVQFYSLKTFKIAHQYKNVKLSEHVKKKYMFPTIHRLGVLNSIWKAFILCYLYIRFRPEYYIEEWWMSRYVKHIRNIFSKNTKIIIDIHGSAPEEYEYLNGCANQQLEEAERYAVANTDYIVCQSIEMRHHLIKKYGISGNIITTFRCGYDPTIFRFSTDDRLSIRRKLEVDDDTRLFVYSGGMHKWQKICDTLSFYNIIHERYPNTKLLVLTKDVEGLEKIITKNNLIGIKDSMIVKSLQFKDVPKYLCASDVAFLLRDNVVMNAVAFPTKLSEYLACGLKVISTEVAEKWISAEGMKYIYTYGTVDIESLVNPTLDTEKQQINQYAIDNLSLNIDCLNVQSFFKNQK